MATFTGYPCAKGWASATYVSNAKTQFVSLQEANDACDLGRLRDYLTPEIRPNR